MKNEGAVYREIGSRARRVGILSFFTRYQGLRSEMFRSLAARA
jgi:hypothetical protein